MQASITELSQALGINVKTGAKGRKRARAGDMQMGPKDAYSTVLGIADEAVVIVIRHHGLLPLGDCLYARQPSHHTVGLNTR